MELKSKKVLVVGGAGFIGSHVVDQLLREPVSEVVVFDNFVRGTRRNLASAASDPRLRVIEGTITDGESLAAAMAGTDAVVHLAALWLHECVHEPRAALEVNVMGTFHVAEAARRAGVERLVYSSSASVYGDAASIPMTEEHPFNNRTMYGATKLAGEQILRAYNEQHRLAYVGLRYMNVYGPRMDYKGTYTSVVMKVLDCIEEDRPPVIFGDGSQSYDFVHVSDVARANVLALKAGVSDQCLNIGAGVRTTINELVQILLELTGSRQSPQYKPQEQMFVTHRVGSTDRARELLGFEASVPLHEGLRSVVEWRRGERPVTV